MEATESINRQIEVHYFFRSTKKSVSMASIQEAINEVKSESNQTAHSTKIVIEGEVMYFSERHGEIGHWENEWKRQKRKLSLDENAYDCPHGEAACYKNDLCINCKMDAAQDRASA